MRFKLGGERRLAPHLAALAAPLVAGLRPSLLVPVPSTAASVAARGFDPAALLARALARQLGVPARPLLAKVRPTRDQAGLTAAERRANQAGAYRARGRAPGRVVLVDDILTTGATADSCTTALAGADISDVAVVVIARVP